MNGLKLKGLGMLVLSRRPGQKVLLWVGGVQVAITVTYSDSQRARLGFDAPESVTILREEVHLASQAADRRLGGSVAKPHGNA